MILPYRVTLSCRQLFLLCKWAKSATLRVFMWLPETCPCDETKHNGQATECRAERGFLRETAMPMVITTTAIMIAVAAGFLTQLTEASSHSNDSAAEAKGFGFLIVVAGYFASYPYMCVAITMIAALFLFLLMNACLTTHKVSREQRNAIHREYFSLDSTRRILENADNMASRLGEAIRFKTVSYDQRDAANQIDYSQFLGLHKWFEKNYPLVHQHLEKHVINKYSLVYVWRGAGKKSQEEKPWMAYAHMDVVPQANEWVKSPNAFSGEIRDGFVYGRGAIDLKNMCVGWMEALETLLSDGFRPRRTFVLGLGHDEEIGGHDGGAHIAKWVSEEFGGENCLEFLWDEGLFCIRDVIAGHKDPIAMICCSEKGSVSLRLTVDAPAGMTMHSSVPDVSNGTPIGILSKACQNLEANPMPGHSHGPMRNLLAAIAPGFGWPKRLLMSNLWLFAPLVKMVLTAKHKTAAIVRTTTALTIFKAGNKVNVMPKTASCTINHRVHPGDTIQKVIDYDKRIINDHRVRVEKVPGTGEIEPSKVSDHQTESFADMADMIHAVYPEAAVAPSMFLANSDSKHFWGVAEQIYRFNPIMLHESEVKRFHGIDECIEIKSFVRCVLCFKRFLESTDRRVVPK